MYHRFIWLSIIGVGGLKKEGRGLLTFFPCKRGLNRVGGVGGALQEGFTVFSETIWGEGKGGKHMQYFYMSAFNRDIVFQGNIKIPL